MYYKNAGQLGDKDWGRRLSLLGITKEEENEVKQILTMPTKEGIESNFDRLYELGVINGIGPGYMGRFFRLIISLIFKGVRFEHHDIGYFIGGGELDRLYCDYGLLKYSFITIVQNLKTVYLLEYNLLSRVLLFLVTLILSIPQMIVSVFCFIMVFIFGRFGSFEYNGYDLLINERKGCRTQ